MREYRHTPRHGQGESSYLTKMLNLDNNDIINGVKPVTDIPLLERKFLEQCYEKGCIVIEDYNDQGVYFQEGNIGYVKLIIRMEEGLFEIENIKIKQDCLLDAIGDEYCPSSILWV